MKRKIISLFLIISFFCSISVVGSSTDTTTESNMYAKHLINLGIFPSNIDPDYIVTRAEFVKAISSMYDDKYISYRNEIPFSFSDVSSDEDWYDALTHCVVLNLVNGYSDGTFRPQKAVTINEVFTVAVNMIGYNIEAHYKGGWPFGYALTAKNHGLTNMLYAENYSSNITARQLAVILYNVMNACVSRMDYMDDDGNAHYSSSTETFGEKYRKLSHLSGVINANGYANFSYTHHKLGEEQLSCDDVLLTVSSEEDMDKIGYRCDLFYDKETMKILSIVNDDYLNKSISMFSNNIIDINGNYITYNADKLEKKITIPSGIVTIYNGYFTLYSDIESILTNNDAKITFIDNNNDGKFDVMIIEEYTVVVVKSKNYDTTVTDRIENDILSLDERQYDYYSVKDKNGSDIDFTAVKENNIITAVKNNRYIKAYVSDTVYTGIYYGVATELENHIQIGDETFEVALSYKNKLDNNLIGKNVTAYLDHFGNVAYMSQAVHNDYSVGFLIKSAFKSSVSKNDLKLKLLTSTGEIKVLSTRENFKIDNEFCKVSELKSAPLSLNKKEPIKYKVDENNEITEIDFPETSYSNDNDGFFRGNSISDVTFSNTNKMFGGKIELGENSIVFSIPENYNSDDAKDEDFRVVNFSLPNTKFVVDGYYFSTQSVYADVIVIKSNILTMDYDSPSGAITKITTVKNDEGINVLKVYYQDGNNEKTFYANLQKTPSFSSVTKGDSIQFSIDKNNYLTEFKLLYDISEKAFVQANPSASNYNDSIRYSMGYAAKINNGRVRLSKTSFFPDDTSVFEFDLYNTSQYFKTVVIENSLGNCIVRSGSFNEINVGDLLVIVMRNGIGKVIFIYKN